jgi:asparagine synthase (glutamine-hydrolysing)
LAHQRLAIIDLTEAGHQAMATQDGRLTISFNNKIYNNQALHTGLEQKNCVLQSNKSLIKIKTALLQSDRLRN